MELAKKCDISAYVMEMLKEVFGTDYGTLIHQERVLRRTTFIGTLLYYIQPLDWKVLTQWSLGT